MLIIAPIFLRMQLSQLAPSRSLCGLPLRTLSYELPLVKLQPMHVLSI